MLATQVNYFNYLETRRHNLATEEQGRETLAQGKENLRIQDFNSQTQRMSQQEQARHNEASETISIASLHETERHNVAMEEENVRHNVQTENISKISANAASLSAQASMTSAQANMKSAILNETKWNTSGYYVEQTERNKNIAQTAYYESQSTSGMMGAIGRIGSAIGGIIKAFK